MIAKFNKNKIQYRRLFFAALFILSVFISLFVCKNFWNLKDNKWNIENADTLNGQDYYDLGINYASLSCTDFNCDEDKKILGFSMPANDEESFKNLKLALVEAGWQYIPNDNQKCASFVRKKIYQEWIYVNCVYIADQTSVVIVHD